MNFADRAVIAASSASDATSELLRYAREGNAFGTWPFGEQEPTVALVEALILTGEIEAIAYSKPGFEDELQQLGQLLAACRKFVGDWHHAG